MKIVYPVSTEMRITRAAIYGMLGVNIFRISFLLITLDRISEYCEVIISNCLYNKFPL